MVAGARPLTPSGPPCTACGQVHRYLMRLTPVGDGLPVRFPPGVPVPRHVGVEVDLHLAGAAERPPAPPEQSRYAEVAARVRRSSIRCEGCGERFEELEAYQVHACAVHYR